MRVGLLGLCAALLLAPLPPALAGVCQTPGNVAAGDALYHQTCVTCHGEDGHGVHAGTPDFTSGVMAYSTASLFAHIKNGFHAPGRIAAMPPKGNNPALTDDDIRNLIAYLRHRFGCG